MRLRLVKVCVAHDASLASIDCCRVRAFWNYPSSLAVSVGGLAAMNEFAAYTALDRTKGLMPMAGALINRHLEPELMDDPSLDSDAHHRALRGLKRINSLSRSAATLWRVIRQHCPAPRQPLRLLDIACGGGDVTIALARHAQRDGMPISIHGCDVSDVALAYARERRKQ